MAAANFPFYPVFHQNPDGAPQVRSLAAKEKKIKTH